MGNNRETVCVSNQDERSGIEARGALQGSSSTCQSVSPDIYNMTDITFKTLSARITKISELKTFLAK